MANIDEAYEHLEKVVKEIKDSDSMLTEEDTKLQCINRILVSVMGWRESQILAERHHESGFSDYILRYSDQNLAILEAKRVGRLRLESADRSRVRTLKISGPALRHVQDGIHQAFSYASGNGLSLAILTDGETWIFFKTFIEGNPYKEGNAIVFPSLDSLLADFPQFYELLSAGNLPNGLYKIWLDRANNKRAAKSVELRAPFFEQSIRLSAQSQFAFDLDEIFNKFFSKISDENNDEMLLDCFVETKESRIADFSLEKMTANILGNLDPDIQNVDRDLAALIQKNLETDASESVEAGQTVFIVGPTGSGKSTFLRRFFKTTLSPAVRDRCLVIRINFLDSTGTRKEGKAWVVEELISEIERQNYSSGFPSYEELQGLYQGEYKRRATSTRKHTYERNKLEFKEEFGRYLEAQVHEDREGYLRRLLEDTVMNRKKLPVLIFDNTDEFDPEFKRDIFQISQAYRRSTNHCLVLFPITDKSAWSFSKTDIYGIYKTKSFFLPTPPPREIFQKRLEYLNGKIWAETDEGEKRRYFTSKGIGISIENIEGFARVIEQIFVNEDYTSRTLGQLSNYNIRDTFLLSQRVLASAVFDIEEGVKSFVTGHPINSSFSKFLLALIRGNYSLFKRSDDHKLLPIFDVEHERPYSPLLQLRILSLLSEAKRGRDKKIEDRHLKVSSITQYFDALGCDEISLESALRRLLEANLLEAYDPSNRSIYPSQMLAITSRGEIHLNLCLFNGIMFRELALTTPIANLQVAQEIEQLFKSKEPFRQREEAVKSIFSQFLLDEDSYFFANDRLTENHASQILVLEQISKMGASRYEPQVADLGEEFEPGIIEENALCSIEWFDSAKRFGFAESDSLSEGVFVHADQFAHLDIRELASGDVICCDIERNEKGLAAVNISEVLEDDNVSFEDSKVVRLIWERGYGFAHHPSGNDAIFYLNSFDKEQLEALTIGSMVRSAVYEDKHGRLQLKKVQSVQ